MTELWNRSSVAGHTNIWIHVSEWLEMVLMQMLLSLTLWPLILMYKRPKPDESWPAWQANQRLCRIDRRYC
ncbi:hypothetical protein [Synechococcus sp. MIT S9503]|uniref:hypothetical protein n=1 Tax=Synechococcus sp. MIT S9503 TaxID=3082547 RepID=UPI0039A69613|tara:strand:+ start:1595 stop:1807 length:213 start_codon:yes stop_codon:yes gene_type:complete